MASSELDALGRLQRLLGLDSKSAAAWEHEVRRERRAVVDCMIDAAAISEEAAIATANRRDLIGSNRSD